MSGAFILIGISCRIKEEVNLFLNTLLQFSLLKVLPAHMCSLHQIVDINNETTCSIKGTLYFVVGVYSSFNALDFANDLVAYHYSYNSLEL